MAKPQRTGRRIARQPTEEERQYYRQAREEELAGMEANKALGRELLRERRELAETVTELKAIRERLGITPTELA